MKERFADVGFDAFAEGRVKPDDVAFTVSALPGTGILLGVLEVNLISARL